MSKEQEAVSGRTGQPDIDYTTALLREDRRRQRSEELIRRHGQMSSNSVRVGFIPDNEYRDLGDDNNDVWFDVLPSFEMHRSMHEAAAIPSTESPPNYDATSPAHELFNTQTTTSSSSSAVPIATGDAAVAPSLTARSSFSADAVSSVSSYHDDFAEASTSHPSNAHTLPKIPIHPLLTVEIHITKNAPRINEKPELESMLKEYTSGDLLHGYVIVNNGSPSQVPFHMFYVTLEGAVSIVDKDDKKMYLRRFLHMMDLNASWSYGCISPSSNIRYQWGDSDWDGCRIGLPPDRLLEPKTKYKKFFTFRVPYNLLDNTCKHGEETHTLLPPSLGINRFEKHGKYSQLDVNESLGYGHLGKRGSPILTRDQSGMDKSVNYSINATLLGIHPTMKDAMGRPMSAIMRDEDYALRFIPFGFAVPLLYSMDAVNRLKGSVESSIKNAERRLLLCSEDNRDAVAQLDTEVKLQQLSLSHETDTRPGEVTSFPLRNTEFASADYSKITTSVKYVPVNKKVLFGKREPTSNQSGIVNIITTIPKDGLPYISPSLIRKTNEVSKLNALGLANYDLMANALEADEKKKLTHLVFDMTFTPSDLAAMNATSPPEVGQIMSKLMVINAYSTSSIPIKLSTDLFMNDCEGFHRLKSEFSRYETRLEKLKIEFKDCGCGDFERYVHRSVEDDIHAMKNLKAESTTHAVFKNRLKEDNGWVKDVQGNWTRHIVLDLEFHDSIRETLVPTFQTCLMSRIYCIQTEFNFKNCSKVGVVRVPIRLRWFD